MAIPKAFRDKNKIALVLSGGGVKAAAFHLGVCLALQQKEFSFCHGLKGEESAEKNKPLAIDTYVGSSAGAAVAAILSAGYSIHEIIDSFTNLSEKYSQKEERTINRFRKPSYLDIITPNKINWSRAMPSFGGKKKAVPSSGFESFLKNHIAFNGLASTRGIEKWLRKKILTKTNRFSELGVDLFVIATQLNHSRKAVFGDWEENMKNYDVSQINYTPISDACAASMALPPFFSPYPVVDSSGKEIYFYDGSIKDTLSTEVAVNKGADLVIASYSLQPYHYNPAFGSLTEFGIASVVNQAVYQVTFQKINDFRDKVSKENILFSIIQQFCKEHDIPENKREKLLEIISDRLEINPETDYIFIHPRPQDYEFFFGDHFSLSTSVLTKIVNIGFRSALNTLRQHNL